MALSHRSTSIKVALLFLAMMALATLPVICSAKDDVELVQAGDQFLSTDRGAHGRKLLNLKCGLTKCDFNQICCSGVCTDPMTDKNNCGICGKKCSKVCQFSLCDYGIGKLWICCWILLTAEVCSYLALNPSFSVAFFQSSMSNCRRRQAGPASTECSPGNHISKQRQLHSRSRRK